MYINKKKKLLTIVSNYKKNHMYKKEKEVLKNTFHF